MRFFQEQTIYTRNSQNKLNKGPEIKYMQIENEQTCLVTSLSSVLHYAKAYDHASQLFGERKNLTLGMYGII